MTAGDMADGKGHGQYRQAKSQGYPQQTYPHIREGGGQDRTAAPAQDQPKGSHKLSSVFFHDSTSLDLMTP